MKTPARFRPTRFLPLLGVILFGTVLAEDISPENLPATVKTVLAEKFPGLQIKEASSEIEDGVLRFEVKGTAGGKTVKVKITELGKHSRAEDQRRRLGERK